MDCCQEIYRGYHVAAQRYKICRWVLKNISRVVAVNECNIFQHEKINFVSPSNHVIFFLLHKIFTIHNNICGNFLMIPKISKVFQNLSVGQTNFSEHFPNISNHFPNITEDNRRLAKTTKEGPKMFWSYTNKFKCS